MRRNIRRNIICILYCMHIVYVSDMELFRKYLIKPRVILVNDANNNKKSSNIDLTKQ